MAENDGRIDLDQLAARESEQIEWKENVADIDGVVETLSAFANDLSNLGGGYVVCGAAEIKDEHGFAAISRVGLTADRLKELEGTVLTRCRDKVSPGITPLVDEVLTADPSRRILIFTQPATGHAHTARRHADGAKHFVRISRNTVEARNGILRDLLVRKGDLEPWDRRVCPVATIEDLDLLALRDTLQRMRVFSATTGIEPYLSSDFSLSPFVPPLFARDTLSGVLRPRNFAVLLFGRDTQRLIPGAISLFSIYPGIDRADIHAERHENAGTVLQQAQRLMELLDVQSYTAFDKADARAPNAIKYPRRALYEAMGNALAHRDYELPDPTRLTVFDNRVEIFSPGSLPSGVDPTAFSKGQAGPKWRNQTLAWFFNRLQIAQAEGQGIPTILRSMKEEGCPPPDLQAGAEHVLCVLPAHPRHALLRDFREVERALALGELRVAQGQVLRILQQDHMNFRALQLFGEIQHALKEPDLVAQVLGTKDMQLEQIPSSVLLELHDALVTHAGDAEPKYRELSARILTLASRGKLEEREMRRISVSLLRNKGEQEVLELIDGHLRDHPEWINSPSILQLRGDAYLGLAKKCRNTARKSNIAYATRERIWKEFRAYVDKAEAELRRARELSIDSGLTSVISRNLKYVGELREGDKHRRESRPTHPKRAPRSH